MKMNLLAVGALAAVALSATSALAGDAAKGEALAKKQCLTCHTFEQGGANKVGPNLFGVTADGPGKAEGFKYSEGFVAAAATGFAWDDAHLEKYLTDPTAFLREVSGDDKARSKMTFKVKEADRADIIAFLHTLK